MLTWHVRYGEGCDGDLNVLLDQPAGATFTITTAKGTTSYRITEQVTVPNGKYRASWFSQSGPHRLALFTCGGLERGRFTQTVATFAERVPSV